MMYYELIKMCVYCLCRCLQRSQSPYIDSKTALGGVDRAPGAIGPGHVSDIQGNNPMNTPRIQPANSIGRPAEKQRDQKGAEKLAHRFEVSERAIQKNLEAFDKGMLRQRNSHDETYSPQSRLAQVRREDVIARLALNYIAEGLTILLDAGSTTLSLARALRGSFQSLCVITNSIPAALELSKTNYKILLTGGEVTDSNLALIGSAATKTLKRYHADRAFLGTSGITVAHGYSTDDPFEAQVKQAMIRAADETYVLADSSKFGHAYLESFASLSAISLTLTDSGMPEKFRDAFAERGIGFKCP
jgi:DeoR family transcriptional regulator, fructose operon transcriptional repressor